MNKPYPALCRDCKHSEPDAHSYWTTVCLHPKVNANDPWALSSNKPASSSTKAERTKTWFAKCGMKGKLWEAKE